MAINRTLLYALSLLLMLACSKKEEVAEVGVTLTGKVNYPQQGLIILDRMEGEALVAIDTIELDKKNTFSVFVPNSEPMLYRLNFYNKQAVNLIIDKTDVDVVADGNFSQGQALIEGSPDMDYLNAVNKLATEFQTEVAPINQKFLQARNNNDVVEMQRIQTILVEKQKKVVEVIKEKISSMGTSIAAIFAANYVMSDDNFPFLKELADKFNKELPNSVYTKQFVSKVNEMGKLAIGELAPDFTLPNPNGEMITLSSFRGKYILVDFWAKWCKPCRMENPNVVKAYKKYHDKGFDIVGVSLDKKREDWLQAIEQDGLIWNHVSDLKFWQSEVVPLYSIKGIPFAVLLDPEGRIVAKNLRGRQLDEKLAELLL